MQRRWIIQDQRVLKAFCCFFRKFRIGDVKYELFTFIIRKVFEKFLIKFAQHMAGNLAD
jgi:hypothetical protein